MDLARSQHSKEFDCVVGNDLSSLREGVKWATIKERKENST